MTASATARAITPTKTPAMPKKNWIGSVTLTSQSHSFIRSRIGRATPIKDGAWRVINTLNDPQFEGQQVQIERTWKGMQIKTPDQTHIIPQTFCLSLALGPHFVGWKLPGNSLDSKEACDYLLTLARGYYAHFRRKSDNLEIEINAPLYGGRNQSLFPNYLNAPLAIASAILIPMLDNSKSLFFVQHPHITFLLCGVGGYLLGSSINAIIPKLKPVVAVSAKTPPPSPTPPHDD